MVYMAVWHFHLQCEPRVLRTVSLGRPRVLQVCRVGLVVNLPRVDAVQSDSVLYPQRVRDEVPHATEALT